MTLLQGSNLLIGLLLYPYLIRTLGQSMYGTYVFVNSGISFFLLFLSFGFSTPAVKKVSLYVDNLNVKNEIVSTVFTAKVYLFFLTSIVFGLLFCFIPFLQMYWQLYLIVFSLTIGEVLFPVWYFQGIQRMRLVTYIQLGTRVLTIPMIFIFVKSLNDLLVYAIIISSSVVLGALIAVVYMQVKEKIILRFVSFSLLKELFKDSLPFFWTNTMGVIKRESVTLIIGSFFGMKDVALYDLANKLVMIPRLITMNINTVIFPRIIKNPGRDKIKKIIRFETLISLIIITLITAFGYWAVLLLGGKSMVESYFMAIILSFTIYTWLIVGCYIHYIFVPQNRYYFVTKNQFAALVSFLLLCGIGLFVYKSILLIVLAYVLSSFVEIIYCRYLIHKYQLFSFKR